MSTKINNKTCYATTGNMSLSGTLVTLKLMSAKADAQTIFDFFADGAYTIRVGANTTALESFLVNGWYQRDRSGVQMREAYAEITLVFDRQNVLGLNETSGNTDRFEPTYSLGITMDERPIEQHPNFKCIWAYNLYELIVEGGTPSAVPAWATTDNNPAGGTRAVPVEREPQYLWSRSQPPSPEPGKYYKQVKAAIKFGVDSYLIPRPSVTSVIYYKSRNIAQSDIINGGKLKAPPETYIYPNTQTCWLCEPSGVNEASDDLMAVTTTYVYAAEGWDTDIYALAT